MEEEKQVFKFIDLEKEGITIFDPDRDEEFQLMITNGDDEMNAYFSKEKAKMIIEFLSKYV